MRIAICILIGVWFNSVGFSEGPPGKEPNSPSDASELSIPSLRSGDSKGEPRDPKIMGEALEILRNRGSLLNGSELEKVGGGGIIVGEIEDNNLANEPSRKESLAAESILKAARLLDHKGKRGQHQEKVRLLRRLAMEILVESVIPREIEPQHQTTN